MDQNPTAKPARTTPTRFSAKLTEFVAGGIKNLERAKKGNDVQDIVPEAGISDGGIGDEAPKHIEGEAFITDNAGDTRTRINSSTTITTYPAPAAPASRP